MNQSLSDLLVISLKFQVTSPPPTIARTVETHLTLKTVSCVRETINPQNAPNISQGTPRERVLKLNLCFNCLSAKHKSKFCKSKHSCRKCHNRHHTAICSDLVESGQHQSTRSVVNTQHSNGSIANNSQVQGAISSELASNSLDFPEPTSTNANSGTRPKSTTSGSTPVHCTFSNLETASSVMPTATLKLSHQNTQTYTRALIDSGLQLSFICAKLANKPKLPVVGTVNMNLSTFGTDPTPQVFHVVRAKMQIGSRRFTGKLIVHDNVNTEIVSLAIHKITSMLANKGINLADSHVNGDKLRNVQLLIRVDYFNQIVISQKKVFGVHSFITSGGLIPFGPLPAWSHPAISYDESWLYCNRVLCEPPLESLWDLETIGISTERFTHDEKIAVGSVASEMEHTIQGYVL